MKKILLFMVMILSLNNVFAILDCDNDSTCRGLGEDYICNSSYQCVQSKFNYPFSEDCPNCY